MKIAHVTSAHLPFDPRIFHKECVSLANAGHEVYLVAAGANAGTESNVTLVPVPKPAKRLLRMSVGARATILKASRLSVDLYHLHDPELLPWALLLQRRTRRPVIYDSHEYLDLNMESRTYVPGPLRKPAGWLAHRIEKEVVRRLAGVVAVDSAMAARFESVNKRVAVVSNFPHLAFGHQKPPDYEKVNPGTVVYLGSLTAKSGFRLVLQAMPLVRQQRPGAMLWVIGRIAWGDMGTEFDWARSQLSSVGIDSVGYLPYEEVPRSVATNQVGWWPGAPTAQNKIAIPTKVLEYMALGLPVVASRFPAMERIISEADCGILADPLSPEEHAQALAYLMENPAEARRLGENGHRAMMSKYTWEGQFESLLSLYEDVLHNWG
jgi:glycosyltransferase involved in cell wall biosynthesis